MFLKTVGSLVLFVFLGIAIEFAGMGHLWEPHDGSRLRDRVAIEHNALEAQVGSQSMDFLDQLQSVYLGWIDAAIGHFDSQSVGSHSRTSNQANTPSPLAKSVEKVALTLAHYSSIAAEFVRATAFRFAALSIGIAVAAALGAVGFTDGLVRRDIRRWSGGRESSRIYNVARRMIGPGILAYSLVFIVWPWPLHIGWTIACYSSICAVLLSVASSRFKKYL